MAPIFSSFHSGGGGRAAGFGMGPPKGAPPVTAGEAVWTNPGTYSWTVPSGGNWSMVCVGGGAASSTNGSSPGSSPRAAGGGGGALSYYTGTFSPGQTITVRVGRGGRSDSENGQSSYIQINGTQYAGANGGTCAGPGGDGNHYGGTPFGTRSGGGQGGDAGWGNNDRGGGGAGGYDGRGGGNNGSSQNGGGGHGANDGGQQGGGGGGVGLYGRGPSGADYNSGTQGGGGGSGGNPGQSGGGNGGGAGPYGGQGGTFGGGAGHDDQHPSRSYKWGGNGGVRLIWGTGRNYPTTNTSQSASQGVVYSNPSN